MARLGALMVLVPYLLIQASGYSAVQAGSRAGAVRGDPGAGLADDGALAGRIGSASAADVGPLVVAAGFLLLWRVGAQTNYWTVVLSGHRGDFPRHGGRRGAADHRRAWVRWMRAIRVRLRASTAPWRAPAA